MTAGLGALMALAGQPGVLLFAVLVLAGLAVAYWRPRLTPSAAQQAPLLDLVRDTLDLRPAPT